jgi:hypothetical protein
MAWAAEPFDRHHAIGASRSRIRSSCRTAAAANQATRPVVQTGVVSGVPINAMCREVESIVIVVGASPRAGRTGSAISAGVGLLEVKAPAAYEIDRFAQCGRHGGEELVISVKRHRHTPSP